MQSNKKNEIKIIKFPDSFHLKVGTKSNIDHNRLDEKKVEQVIDHMNEKMLEIGFSIREFYHTVISVVDTWNHWCLYEGQQQFNLDIKMENREPVEILLDVKRATALRRTYPK